MIRRHCSIRSSIVLRRLSERSGAKSFATCLRVPRFFGLLGPRLAQIGFVDVAAATALSRSAGSEKTSAIVKSVYAPEEKGNPRVTIVIE